MNKKSIFLSITTVFILAVLLSGCFGGGYKSAIPVDSQLKVASNTVRNSEATTSKISPSSSGVTGYGEISKVTGRPRTNVVSGYYRKNGTYVRSYARS